MEREHALGRAQVRLLGAAQARDGARDERAHAAVADERRARLRGARGTGSRAAFQQGLGRTGVRRAAQRARSSTPSEGSVNGPRVRTERQSSQCEELREGAAVRRRFPRSKSANADFDREQSLTGSLPRTVAGGRSAAIWPRSEALYQRRSRRRSRELRPRVVVRPRRTSRSRPGRMRHRPSRESPSMIKELIPAWSCAITAPGSMRMRYVPWPVESS